MIDEIIAEFQNISEIPVGEKSNMPLDSGWETCHPGYQIVEDDASQKPGKILSNEKALYISPSRVKWFYLIGGYIWQG